MPWFVEIGIIHGQVHIDGKQEKKMQIMKSVVMVNASKKASTAVKADCKRIQL